MQSLTGAGRLRAVLIFGGTLVWALWLGACATGTAAPSEAAPIILNSGPLRVTITAPPDEAVVNSPQVDIVGQAPAETVISIGDTITVVEASGQFSIPVPLQEGPNELEIVASDPTGNQAATMLVVTYEPGS